MRPCHLPSLLLAAVAVPLAAQTPAPAPAAFVVKLGRDTVAVDRFVRGRDRVEGRCLTRSPRTLSREYAIALAPDGAPQRLEYTVRAPGDSAPPGRVTMEFAADSVTVTRAQGDSTATRTVAASGVLPALGNCWTFLELATRRLAVGGGTQAEQLTLGLGADAPDTIALARTGDSVAIEVISGLPYRTHIDAQGRILGARWAGDWRVSRVAAPDMDALASAWAMAPLGPLSPADSVQAMVGTATIRVRYARPAARGRTIFGGVVPWNAVWRTGANEATLIETTHDLQFGTTAVPAGKYSLWTIPAPNGWTLILNTNTGQWGTDYAEQYDLVRIPMRVEALRAPAERVTISVEPLAVSGSGVLVVAWDRTRALAPFTVK
jgi:hypothetical protein